MNNELIEAAKAVIDRWDSSDWESAPTIHAMNRLRNALSAQPEPRVIPKDQQPASVPVELVQQWWKEAVAQASGEYSVAHYIANRAAAYGK